jgi:hypothetical protein
MIEEQNAKSEQAKQQQREFYVKYLKRGRDEPLTQSIDETLTQMRQAKYKGEQTKIGHGSGVTEPQNLAWLNDVGKGDFPISLTKKPDAVSG